MTGYQEVYGDLEEYANALKFSKSKKMWFRISHEQAEIKTERAFRLPDGTTETRVVPGLRYSAKITLTAFGFVNPPDAEPKSIGALSPPKPDTQLLFVSPIAQKDCFVDPNTGALDEEELKAYNAEVDSSWKAVLNEIKKTWVIAAFEGVGSILGGA